MFNSCSGPCALCEVFWSTVPCLAGKGDDDFKPISNKDARKHLIEIVDERRVLKEKLRSSVA